MELLTSVFDEAFAQYAIRPAPGQMGMFGDEAPAPKAAAPATGGKFDETKHPRDEGGKFTEAHHAVAKRFGIPVAAVKSIVETPVEELKARDENGPPSGSLTPAKGFKDHPLGTAKIASFWDKNPENSYVDFMHEFNPKELTNTEPEDMIKQHESYQKYLEWAKSGMQPPPINVVESTNTGKYLSHNRRRTLAAQDAGVKSIKGWLNPNNKETGNPLKYGDVLKAHEEAKGRGKPAEPAAKQPHEMTRFEFRRHENEPKLKAIHDALKAGKTITHSTRMRVTPLTKPEHIRITSAGEIQIPEGRKWVYLVPEDVDRLAKQAGIEPKKFEDRIYHNQAVKDALREGKTVPEHVLAEYPGIHDEIANEDEWQREHDEMMKEHQHNTLSATFDAMFAQYAIKPAKSQPALFGFDNFALKADDETGKAKKPAKADAASQPQLFGHDHERGLFAKPAKPHAHEWDESKHPRGQPENKGEFVKREEQQPATPQSESAAKPTRDDAIKALRESSSMFRHVETASEDEKKVLRDPAGGMATKTMNRLIDEKLKELEEKAGPVAVKEPEPEKQPDAEKEPEPTPKESEPENEPEAAPEPEAAEPATRDEPEAAEAAAGEAPITNSQPPDQPVGEPVTVPKEALPKLFTQAMNDKIADFGEHIEGARKHQARPLGPRGDKAETEKDDRPAWARRYRVAEDAKRPGEFFIVDERKGEGWSGRKNVVWPPNKRSTRENFKSREEAEEAIATIEVNRNHAVGALNKAGEKDFVIYRKVSDRKHPVVKRGFATYDEAEKYMNSHQAEIIEHDFPDFETYRYLDNVERNGPEHREGDVTPADFQESFNFRGGQFGNWNHGKDGQTSLNHAYDALHDLSDALGLPAKTTALNGNLSIAFGARGTGGKHSALAHFEPAQQIINLTKMKSAGSLAHEWGHAFDDYLAKEAGMTKAGSTVSGGVFGQHKLRPEVADALKAIKDAINTKEVTTTGDTAKTEKHADTQRQHLETTINNLEQAFAPSTYRKVKPFTPAQQKEWDETKAKILAGDHGGKAFVEGKSRMGGHDTFKNLQKLNELYKVRTGRSFHTADRDSMGNHIYWQIKRVGEADERMKEAKAGKEYTGRVRSDFMNESLTLDQTRVGDYYSQPEEMFARAFEAYVQDKLDAQGRKSQYLVARTHNKHYIPFDMKPYPEGEERTAINSAFDNLFSVLQHEPRTDENGEHVRLYALADQFNDQIAKYASLFSEDDHPRGQPENAGEFRKKEGATGPKKPTKKPAAEQEQLFATSDQGTLFGRQAPRIGDLKTAQPSPKTMVDRDAEIARLKKKVQSQYMGPESVYEGKRKAGFVDGGALRDVPREAQEAHDLGLMLQNAGQFWIYSRTQDEGDALADHLEKYGYGKTQEQREQLSRLAGYSDAQIKDFRELMRLQEGAKTESPADALRVTQSPALPGQKSLTSLFDAAIQQHTGGHQKALYAQDGDFAHYDSSSHAAAILNSVFGAMLGLKPRAQPKQARQAAKPRESTMDAWRARQAQMRAETQQRREQEKQQRQQARQGGKAQAGQPAAAQGQSSLHPDLHIEAKEALMALGHKAKEADEFLNKLGQNGKQYSDLQDVLRDAMKAPSKAVERTVPEGQFKPAEKPQHRPAQQGQPATEAARPTTGSGRNRWVTIGAKNHHGGTHVLIDGDGKIEKGPSGLKGENVDDLKDSGQKTGGGMPPVPEGHVRFYHGGHNPTSGGGRWVSPSQDYAQGYANKSGGQVHFVDVPKSAPHMQSGEGAMDDWSYGPEKTIWMSHELPEEFAKKLRPIEAQASGKPQGQEGAASQKPHTGIDAGFYDQFKDQAGTIDGDKAAQSLSDTVRSQIDAGHAVTMTTDNGNKKVNIVGMKGRNFLDDKGQQWGVLASVADKDSFQFTPHQSPGARPGKVEFKASRQQESTIQRERAQDAKKQGQEGQNPNLKPLRGWEQFAANEKRTEKAVNDPITKAAAEAPPTEMSPDMREAFKDIDIAGQPAADSNDIEAALKMYDDAKKAKATPPGNQQTPTIRRPSAHQTDTAQKAPNTPSAPVATTRPDTSAASGGAAAETPANAQAAPEPQRTVEQPHDPGDRHLAEQIAAAHQTAAEARREADEHKRRLAENEAKIAELKAHLERTKQEAAIHENSAKTHAKNFQTLQEQHQAAKELLEKTAGKSLTQGDIKAKLGGHKADETKRSNLEQRASDEGQLLHRFGDFDRSGSEAERATLASAALKHDIHPDKLRDAVDREVEKDKPYWDALNEVAGGWKLSPWQRSALAQGDVTSLKNYGDFEESREKAEQMGLNFDDVFEAIKKGMPPKPSADDPDYVAKVAREMPQRGESDESDIPAVPTHAEDDDVPFSIRGRGLDHLIASYARRFDDAIAFYAAKKSPAAGQKSMFAEPTKTESPRDEFAVKQEPELVGQKAIFSLANEFNRAMYAYTAQHEFSLSDLFDDAIARYAEFDPEKHPRGQPENKGEFVEVEDQPKEGENSISARKIPQSEDEAEELAYELREHLPIAEGERAENGDCVIAAHLMKQWFPESQIWAGNYQQDPGQYHLIAKVGDYFIDATADQFDYGRDIQAQSFTEDDMEPGGYAEEYGGFRPLPHFA